MVNGLGDANVHTWIVANATLVSLCSSVVVGAIYLFSISLLLFGLATSTTPATLVVIWVFFMLSMTWVLMINGSAAAFGAVHSGGLSEQPVLPPGCLMRLKDHAHAARLLADKALVHDGDRTAMVNLYKEIYHLQQSLAHEIQA